MVLRWSHRPSQLGESPLPHAIRSHTTQLKLQGPKPCRDVAFEATRLLCFDEYTAALNRPQTRMDIGLEQLFVCMNF